MVLRPVNLGLARVYVQHERRLDAPFQVEGFHGLAVVFQNHGSSVRFLGRDNAAGHGIDHGSQRLPTAKWSSKPQVVIERHPALGIARPGLAFPPSGYRPPWRPWLESSGWPAPQVRRGATVRVCGIRRGGGCPRRCWRRSRPGRSALDKSSPKSQTKTLPKAASVHGVRPSSKRGVGLDRPECTRARGAHRQDRLEVGVKPLARACSARP